MEDFEDDTHFCLKCHSTIIGLENYVNHRKNNCMKQNFKVVLRNLSKRRLLLKSSGGIFTRSKVTAFAREVQEPSKSGKNVWIGGHQLKQFDYDDNQSKLIKTVANLERRKEDIGRSKEIQRIEEYEESDYESEDYDYEDETTDEDAPPRNHTGGKWKPSSPIYWKSSQPERDSRSPPPNFTGGKWKPSPSKKTVSPIPYYSKSKWKSDQLDKYNDDNPPPTFTGSKWSQSKKIEYSLPTADFTKGKWKPKLENSTKWHNEYPPPEHTKGKWKPDTAPETLSPSYTKGKWVSPGIEQEPSSSKEISPTYTKGKWLPSSKCHEKDIKLSQNSPLRKSGGTVQYWCRPCDRRLASKVVYERHLKSELHFKRTLRDNELEENLNFMKDERRVKRKTIEIVGNKEKDDISKKIVRRKTFAKCQVCNSKVNVNLMGKHLISHYHCRKGDLSSETSQKMVLEYIESIIQQSPFQCRICKFYFNAHKDFLAHWLSDDHLATAVDKPGEFFCSYCNFSCGTNEMMYQHLISDMHNEVVSVINRSVPICIKKVNYVQCGTCSEQFRLNIQLKKHMNTFNHKLPENFESTDCRCDICGSNFNSDISLQRHNKNVHKLKSFICGICKLTFRSSGEAKEHRNSDQHYYATLEKKNSSDKTILQKQCQYCSQNFKNFLELKEHIKIAHTEFHSRCPQCGMTFTVPQELSVHLRTNSCKFEDQTSTKKHSCSQCSFGTDSLSQFLFHEALHGEAALMYPEKSSKMTDKKPTPHYKCPKCTKFFPKSSLECHLRTHTKERPYTCSHCKATFVRKNNWLFHEKKHTTGAIAKKTKPCADIGRPFLCSTCGASFKRR
ncbi:hypothetical protein WA026_008353 [Henosepilachna vigintioctopunctata]|uniref:C2H2-type domain-containing protein n=1 Tax=Henosepilachna vigintioctopunctata TaxID=420089 RepID=A0AAW1UGP5_9CUCU